MSESFIIIMYGSEISFQFDQKMIRLSLYFPWSSQKIVTTKLMIFND